MAVSYSPALDVSDGPANDPSEKFFVPSSGGGSGYDPLSQTYVEAVYDIDPAYVREASDGSGSAPSVGDPIGWVPDRTGHGHDLTQATTASKPILRQSGSLYYLEFDSIDDHLTLATNIANTGGNIFGNQSALYYCSHYFAMDVVGDPASKDMYIASNATSSDFLRFSPTGGGQLILDVGAPVLVTSSLTLGTGKRVFWSKLTNANIYAGADGDTEESAAGANQGYAVARLFSSGTGTFPFEGNWYGGLFFNDYFDPAGQDHSDAVTYLQGKMGV